MILKDLKVMIYNEKFEKKFILICPPNLSKTSIDIRRPFNTQIGNYVLILNPTMSAPDSDPELTIAPPVDRPLINPPRLNRSMNIIIWNCRGGNNPEFKRNFRSLVNWHKPPLVALLETKKQNHQALLDKFPFTRMIEVPAAGNSGGLAILWNDALLELDQISTIDQEIHAMIKGSSPQPGEPEDEA
ncbi:hypothetical protein P3L10_013928 [Capsicum annuum]